MFDQPDASMFRRLDKFTHILQSTSPLFMPRWVARQMMVRGCRTPVVVQKKQVPVEQAADIITMAERGGSELQRALRQSRVIRQNNGSLV